MAGSSRPRPGETYSMTTYLLDTNACIALINGAETNVRRRFQRAVSKDAVILLSSVVAFELWYGVAKSQRKDSNTQRLEAFFAGPLEWTLFDDEDARTAGTIRAELEAVGKPIGAYDVLLAGQARRRGTTLVTSNSREFTRVAGLKWEDWALPRR
jgi:tRNA(fMet)-specific endonuclease VapC